MNIPFPATLSGLVFTYEGSSLTMSDKTIKFQPDVGRAIVRRRSSIADDEVVYATSLNEDQYQEFCAFFKNTLKSGVLPFDMLDPDSKQIRTFEFREAPSFTYMGAGYRRCALELLRYDT